MEVLAGAHLFYSFQRPAKEGGSVNIDTGKVISKSVFSRLKKGENIRVVYSEFDSQGKEFKRVYTGFVNIITKGFKIWHIA